MYSYKDIFNIITELRSTGSSNSKKEILEKYKDDNEWKKFLVYVYDVNGKVYGKTKLPIIPLVETIDEIDFNAEGILEEIYSLLDSMADGEVTGKAADEALCDLLVGKANEVVELVGLILKRDIKAKVGNTMIEEVYKDLIVVPPYMRCEKEDKLQKRIKYPAIVQTKEDGLFLNTELIYNPNRFLNDLRVTTRQGFEMSDLPDLFKLFGYMSNFFESVLMGEGLILNEDGLTYMPRAAGNGLITSYVKQSSTRAKKLKDISLAKSDKARLKLEKELAELEAKWQYVKNNIVYVIWDIVPRADWLNKSSKRVYSQRLEDTKLFIKTFEEMLPAEYKGYASRLKLVDTEIVNNEEELLAYYQSKLAQKLEGIVAKNFDLTWCHDVTTEGMIKLKDFKECDLIIVGYNAGEVNTQFEKGIGSYLCESSCGKLVVNITGLTLEQRGFKRVDPNDSSKGIELIDGFNPSANIGKIVAAKFQEVSSKKNSNIKSLNLPNILEIRDPMDKSVADSLEDILKL